MAASALGTVGQIITESRRLLQDQEEPYRYPDSDLVDALNIALLEARRVRADLFLPLNFDIPYYDPATFTATDPFDIEPMYRTSFVFYIVGRMEMRDDEQTQDQRAVAFTTTWKNQLVST